jgi:hypothetical protein
MQLILNRLDEKNAQHTIPDNANPLFPNAQSRRTKKRVGTAAIVFRCVQPKKTRNIK